MDNGNQPDNQPNNHGGVWPPPPSGSGAPPPYLPDFQPLTAQSRAATNGIMASMIAANLSDIVDVAGSKPIADIFTSFASFLNMAVGIIYFVWLYRAYKGMVSLASGRPQSSPGWAIAYYFLPILSFYKPLQIAQEIYRLTDPNPRVANSGKPPALYLYWWLSYIGAQLTGVVESLILPTATKTQLVAAVVPDIVLTTIAAVLACDVINKLTARLHERYDAIVKETTAGTQWQ